MSQKNKELFEEFLISLGKEQLARIILERKNQELELRKELSDLQKDF